MNRLTRALAGAAAALVLLGAIGCGGSSKSVTSSQTGTASSTPAAPAAPGASATSTSPSTASTAPAATAPSSPGPAAGTVRASSGGVTASMRAGTHEPKANQPWPIHFVASSGGRPARATVDYDFLFGGQVVAHRSHYRFTGRFADVIVWPPTAVGYPLTFRAVVVAAGRTLNLDYPVRVRR